MAKLPLVWILLLTIWWFAFASGEIQNLNDFKSFIKTKVIGTFRPWAKQLGKHQFAVMMLMDTDKNWDTFKFSPEPDKYSTSNVQPSHVSEMVNYVATIPAETWIKESHLKGGNRNSERLV